MSPSPNNTTNAISIPERFVCPLTLELMKYPYQDRESGQTYERSAIVEWMCNDHATCPLTRKPLNPSNFSLNNELLMEIYEWKRENDLLSTEFSVEEDEGATDQDDDSTPSPFDETPTTQVSKPSNNKKRVTIQESSHVLTTEQQDLAHLSQKILQQRQDKIKSFMTRNKNKPSTTRIAPLPAVPSYMQMYM